MKTMRISLEGDHRALMLAKQVHGESRPLNQSRRSGQIRGYYQMLHDLKKSDAQGTFFFPDMFNDEK